MYGGTTPKKERKERLGRGRVLTVNIESEVRLTYFDTSSKKIACGAISYDHAVAKIVAWTWT